MNLANEGLEARKKEEEVMAKKRKAEEEATWEGEPHCVSCFVYCSQSAHIAGREQRVGSWRSFASSKNKKKKQKVAILG